MAWANGSSKAGTAAVTAIREHAGNGRSAGLLHPAWVTFVRYCQELQHGEIDCLKIQDGLPVLAEVSTRKIKFT